MKMKRLLYLPALLMALFIVACNSDDDTPTSTFDTSGYYSVEVSSFSLEANDSVLTNLDSVFFSIDLDNARIFNADSLPVGTKINKLVLNIGLPTLKEATIYPYDYTAADTVDYLNNSTDEIDFSKGPARLHLVSANGEVTRDYTIEINVHKTQPDSLVWRQTSHATLATSLAAPTEQGSVQVGDTIITFTAQGTDYSRAITTDIYAGAWTSASATLFADANVSTATAAGSNIYMLDRSGSLYLSTDLGESWTATGATMSHIYGAYGNSLLGVRELADGSYVHTTYPATVETAVPATCPVSATSRSFTYTSTWSQTPMTIFVGGFTASGSATGACWGYDGTAWAEVSNTPLPEIAGMVVVPYFVSRTNNQWQVTERTVLLAFLGITPDGDMNDDTYISYDRGVNWSKASGYLKLPDEITRVEGANGFVVAETMTASRAVSAWMPMADGRLPHWYSVAPYAGASRASKPITEWECPYIYIIGGRTSAGTLSTDMWRGVINRLTFKPLQ